MGTSLSFSGEASNMIATARRPRMRGILILSLLGGLLNLLVGVTLLVNTSIITALDIPVWSTYVFLAQGILQLLIGAAIRTYRRLWLVFGAVIHILAIIHYILNIIAGHSIGGMIWGILFSLAMLYYIYKYLTSEPERSFFS
jgi:hypothetical protein